MIHVIAVVPGDRRGGEPQTLTVEFGSIAPVGAYLDEVYRLFPVGAAVALAVGGKPVAWHREPDGRVVIDGEVPAAA